MKNITYCLVFICTVILLSGCSTNKLKCNGETNEDGIKYNIDLTVEFDNNDILKNGNATLTFEDESTAIAYCELVKNYSENETIVECDKKKVIFNSFENLIKLNEAEKISKQSFLESVPDGITCK